MFGRGWWEELMMMVTSIEAPWTLATSSSAFVVTVV